MLTKQELIKKIRELAPQISSGPLLEAPHQPEDGAKHLRCILNVQDKVVKDQGYILFGWTFTRHFDSIIGFEPDYGEYLVVTHHAVWCAPDRNVIDVTPYKPSDKPLTSNNCKNIIFLVDLSARPVECNKFFALNDIQGLEESLNELREKEQKKCEEAYEGNVDPGTIIFS
jgi:hypothetical protein